MRSFAVRCVAGAAAIAASMGLSGCVQSELRISPDYGQAVRQDLAAQIADPDAHYAGTPSPGSDGNRVSLAQKRYQKGQVIQPSTVTASSGTTGIDNGQSGSGMGTSAPSQ